MECSLAQPAQGLPVLSVALGGDGAGIEHHYVGMLRERDGLDALLLKQAGQSLRFILIDLAAQGIESHRHGFNSSNNRNFMGLIIDQITKNYNRY